MKTRYVVGLLGAAAVLAAACSSKTTYTIDGLCGPLTVASDAINPAQLDISGPCNLGPSAGSFLLGAVVEIGLGATGAVPVAIDAGFVQGSAVLFSTFNGTANIPTPPTFVGITGTFTFNGGTNQFSDATGSATVTDGGVDLTTFKANLLLNGSVSY
jgi:hypothetical protein